MAKIQRQTQKIFGSGAGNDQLAAFGTMAGGSPIYTDDIETLQTSAYEQGWSSAVAANNAPFMEEMNGVQYGLSKQIAYLFQAGIPEWDEGTSYYLDSWCQIDGTFYQSLIDDNIGNSPDISNNFWKAWRFIDLATDDEAAAGESTTTAVTPKQMQTEINKASVGALTYISEWVATDQTDYSSITLPVKKGYMYVVQGSTTIGGVTWNPGDYLIMNEDVAAGGTITDVSRVENVSANIYVQKAGDTMTGELTMDIERAEGTSLPSIIVKANNMELGVTPETSSYIGAMQVNDKNGNRKTRWESSYDTTGKHWAAFGEKKSVSENTYANICVGFDGSGVAYSTAPTPAASADTSLVNIATTGWVNNPSSSTNVVHRTGNETISGVKTFKDEVKSVVNATKGTAPSANAIRGRTFVDNSGNTLGSIWTNYQTDKLVRCALGAWKANSSSDTANSSIQILYPASGNPYTYAPPSDVNNSIVTTVAKSKASNGYFKFGNGLIIQWGHYNTTTANLAITFPTAFTSTNYIALSSFDNGTSLGHYTENAWGYAGTKTTTGCTFIYEKGKDINWVAIGY